MKIIKDAIEKALIVLAKVDNPYAYIPDCRLDHPKDDKNGDYASNAPMQAFKTVKASAPGSKLHLLAVLAHDPVDMARKIKDQLNKDSVLMSIVDNIEVAGAGFINFYLKQEYFFEQAQQATSEGYGKNDNLHGQKTMVEFTDPNPFKEFHIGHLMSNTIGESLTRLFEANGAEVKRVNYQGDIGLHVAKSVWGMQQLMAGQKTNLSDLQGQALQVRQQFMGTAYAYGATKYEEDETAKAAMNALNKVIYDGSDKQINELYQTGRTWSLEYFESIYRRLGTKFDEYFFESEAGTVGLTVVEEGIEKGVLEIGDEGAVVFRGEKYGLHTRVFRNKLGLPTYEGKELGLAKTKYGRWQYDKAYIITANEIDEYFKVLIKVLTLLYPDLGAKTTHLSHGIMKLPTGKMSSRTGKVVTGEGLLDDLKQAVLTKIGEREIQNKDQVADVVAVGALKYTVLKQAVGGDIVYESEKMTNLEGNTGPFVQYAFARCSSILRKFQIKNSQILKLEKEKLAEQEMNILRWIYRYPEVVAEAGSHFAPHLVATYIYELAQRFNSFYQACRVFESNPTSSSTSLGAGKGEVNQLRYLLTQATANVLRSGLGLLGIAAPEEM